MFIYYKCKCMPEQVSVGVRARRDGEDVVYWVKHVVGWAIREDHTRRSPKCKSVTMEYAKIPVTPNKPIGAPVRDTE